MIIPSDHIRAIGIGVSDLKRSVEFYSAVFGMKQTASYILDYMEEIVLGHEDQTSLVLMHWTDGSSPTYRNLPVKLIFDVPDCELTSRAIREAGGVIVQEPTVYETLGNIVIGMGKDPDGYMVELISRPDKPSK